MLFGETAIPFFVTQTAKVYTLYQKEWEVKVWTQFALLSSAAIKFRAKAGRYPRTLNEQLSSVGPAGDGMDSRKARLAVRF